MKPLNKIIFLILFSTQLSIAQDKFICGSDQFEADLIKSDPNFKNKRLTYEKEIYNILNNKREGKNSRITQNDCQPDGNFTLPVVFHIYNLGEEVGKGLNVSDNQIKQALNDLNNLFAGNNTNSVDMEIKFALAIRDPKGNITNGITRVNGSVLPNYSEKGFLGVDVDYKKLNNWPSNRYINIHVGKMPEYGGLAFYPISYNYENEGILINYQSLTGQILAHELGHYFNLYHTFNGDNNNLNCPNNKDCLQNGDYVCDTAPHKNSECISSNCGTQNNINSFTNIMSYCGGNIFTQGQKERFRTSLYLKSRWNLVLTNSIFQKKQYDVGIIELEDDFYFPLCNGYSPRIKVINNGNIIINSLVIKSFVNDSLISVEKYNETIDIDSISKIQLSPLNLKKIGKLNLKIQISEINGLAINNFIPLPTICQEILIRGENINSFNIDFDNNGKESIIIDNKKLGFNNSIEPTVVITEGLGCNFNKALKFNFFDSGSDYTFSTIFLPTFNLDQAFSAYLVFDYAHKPFNNSNQPVLNFHLAKNCDDKENGGPSFQMSSVFGIDSLKNWQPQSCGDWKKDSLDLYYWYSDILDKNNLKFSIEINSYGNNQNLFLDNIAIHKKYQVFIKSNNANFGDVKYTDFKETEVIQSFHAFPDNKILKLSAIEKENSCYKFKNWTIEGLEISTNKNLNYLVNSNSILVANFELIKFNIELEIDSLGGLNVSNGGLFSCDTMLTIKATAKEGFVFANWTDENSLIVSNNAMYTFKVTKNKKLRANFSVLTKLEPDISQNVNIYPNPTDGNVVINFTQLNKTPTKVSVYNLIGKKILVKTFPINGKLIENIDLSKYSSGQYFFVIEKDFKTHTIKLLKN